MALEHFENVPGKTFIDLSVSRNGLANSGHGILLPVMFRAMPDQPAAEGFNSP